MFRYTVVGSSADGSTGIYFDIIFHTHEFEYQQKCVLNYQEHLLCILIYLYFMLI